LNFSWGCILFYGKKFQSLNFIEKLNNDLADVRTNNNPTLQFSMRNVGKISRKITDTDVSCQKRRRRNNQVLFHHEISRNIPASPAYGAYISQPTRYSRVCVQYIDFLDRAQQLTQMLLKQGYFAPRLKSSLQKFDGRHHNLVDHYEMSISQLTTDLLLFT
jgi:hypothetical protein